MKTKLTKKYLLSTISVFALMLSSISVFAEAGKSLFVYGKVELQSSTGNVSPLAKGAELSTGDTVITGINGRTQLRMSDGAIFDLKPNTEFVIENYTFNQASSNGRVVASNESKGFYRLMRGGFRAISGLIGKKNKKNYRVTTPVATIGIRGTDYTLQFCASNCTNEAGFAASTGLYASVLEGGITLSNSGGALDVDPGDTGYVVDLNTAPVFAASAVTATSDDEDAPTPSINRDASDAAGNMISLETGRDAPTSVADTNQADSRFAFSNNGNVGLATGDVTNSGNVATGFSTSDTTYSAGTAESVNNGRDQATGVYWGRWANGTATATNASGTSQVDLNNSSLHWIQSSNQIKPELPLTGTAEFTLVGNTNPTDNFGNRGVLGSASLSADFTNQTVDADVNLSINNQTWDAEAEGVALDGDAATFAGEFDEVTITDEQSGEETDGEGSLNGFFSADDEGELNGAGLTYTLSNEDTTVDGSAAFEVEEIDVSDNDGN